MPELLSKTEEFATNLLVKDLDPNYLYHNLRHTQRVVKSTKELLDFYNLNAIDSDAITIAAWLHDTGYTKGVENHEESSCDIAREFLTQQNCEAQTIETICNLIMATKRGHEPQNLMEEIMRDADASHLAQSSYDQTCEMLREELRLLGIAEISQKEWRRSNIKMFQTEHRFYTDYAIKNWQEGKDDNLKKLIKQDKKQNKTRKKEELKVKLKNQSPERGIQTMFRVTMRNHLKLSDIADTKANILLSVNAIIISLMLTNLIPKLDNPSNDYLIIPAAIFVMFSVTSMIMSVLATRPNVTSGEFTKEDVNQKKVNLLFFGNFHKMKLEDYEWAIQELIKDQKYVYDSLTKDLYFLGVVLDRKYKLLRWTYTIFMIGMTLSVIAFFVALKFYGPERIIELPT
ncbi:Pycsar system effector family protein [Zobellia alginiliquefaciens]|uniref:Pycsar system effector family protein n=1 Tax=Zobellia alginiliquefaciens TaxID=3032586 RepID=UPI0023E44974|nr:Pycsar system effector family protein [Zobellia alginiliquefaciens]